MIDPIHEYRKRLLDNWQAQWYLTSRRVSRSAARVFGLGYFDAYELSPFYDRLMIPVRDPYGELLAFQGRALFDYAKEDKPKYYHSPFDKGGVLYGAYECAEMAVESSFLALVEGPPDVWALWDAGVPAFALMGTTFSQAQAYLVRRYSRRVLLWTDADDAGEKAASLVRRMLEAVGTEVWQLPRHRPFKDASETWQKAGHDGVRRAIDGRV